MKLYKNLVTAVAQGLDEIFFQKKYADKVLETLLKSDKRWGARDRAFVAETTYECVRNIRYLNYLLNEETELSTENLLGIIGVYLILKDIEVPEWEIFSSVPDKTTLTIRLKKAADLPEIINSYPHWMFTKANDALGTKWLKEAEALNRPAQVILRANTLLISKEKLQNKLATLDVETYTTPLAKDALILNRRANVFKLDLFKSGFFEIQDVASQNAAPYLQVEPGMRVIDACAGAGGKSLHLASIMQNKGKIIALDVEQYKLNELQKRATRNRVQNIETRLIDNIKVIKRLEESADRLLLDVPCTGLGVLRRNPDAKWKLTENFLEEVKRTQATILNDYSTMLKPGGLMVYATCSILPEENTEQVEKFLMKNKGKFELVEEKKFYASVQGFDGFYMALLKKV